MDNLVQLGTVQCAQVFGGHSGTDLGGYVNVDTSGVKNLNSLLEQLPSGSAARTLAGKLGLWTTAAHDDTDHAHRAFPSAFSTLSDDRLSDVNAYWLSEAARSGELVGLLEGQKALTQLGAKQARSAARARLRKVWDERVDESGKPVKYTATQLGDEAENDAAVIDQETTAALLSQVLASAHAYKEACLTIVAGVSREISFRQAQYSARLRG